jgi:hypothetical protein
MKHALAGVGPHVQHCANEVQPVCQTIVGEPAARFCGERPDVPVVALEGALPIPVPTLMGVETSGEETALGHHDPVVDGLGMRGHRERHHEKRGQRNRYQRACERACAGHDGPRQYRSGSGVAIRRNHYRRGETAAANTNRQSRAPSTRALPATHIEASSTRRTSG